MKIEWEKIKNGFSGFESLACKYVEMNFPNPNWTQTNATRDGNRDAVAVFLGYKGSESSREKWWMEAKYSTSVDILSRYRLDATIVSAILEKNVTKVIFVTNVIINAKIINDIRNALYNSIQCTDVLFCTKYSLEYWLSNNIDIYKEFFDDSTDTIFTDIEYPDLFVISEIEYYSEISNILIFRESLRELNTDDKYFGYFVIFSSEARKLFLKPHSKMKGITITSDSNISLLPGENAVKFSFYIDEYEFTINDNIYSPIFILGDIEVSSARYIIPLKKNKLVLELSGQKKLIQDLVIKYKKFINDKVYSFNFIEGVSGSGKSYVLENFLKETISPSKEIFFAEFTNSPRNNNELLVYLVLFILFPFLNPADIDSKYLKELQNNFVGCSIIDLVSNKQDFDNLAKIMSNFHINDNIFPIKINIHERIIILDDLQKLTRYEANFLSVIIADLQRHNLPVFAVLSSQPSFYTQKTFNNLIEHCVVDHYIYSIGLNDIFRALPTNKKNSVYLNNEISYTIQFNVVEIFLLSKYIMDNEIVINNIHDFVKVCKIFQRTSILELYILKQFENFFNIYPQCKKICDSIYWASEPKNVDLYDNTELGFLLSYGLVKYNFDSYLVPTHDIYKFYYCKHYKLTVFNENEYKEGSLEIIKYKIEHEIEYKFLLKEANKIIDLSNNQKFYSVSFILQDIFETSQKENLMNRLDKVTYYKLYFAYALSATHQSIEKTGYDIFVELGDEIRNITIPEILELSINVDWDLAIGDYERLRYQKALLRMRTIIISLMKFIKISNKSNDLKQYSKYYDVLMLDTLIRANTENTLPYNIYLQRILLMEKHGFIYRSKSFQVRFALALCTQNMDQCLETLSVCSDYFQKEHGTEDKYYLWAKYHFYYFSMIYNKKPELLNKVIKHHNNLKKNFYLNYRQRINGLASYFYFIGDVTNGNKYMLLEASFDNELPLRQVAFHYETVALHEILINNFEDAKQALQKAIGIFNELPSYQKIAVHNFNVLQKTSVLPNIKYWFGDVLSYETYYIDSRCSW
ncbi:MAG: hypothetical protein HDR24_02950 [Lachnospiraceae bacterium]|nr:hypothetical protein [Lachnospiraceae bacterium]